MVAVSDPDLLRTQGWNVFSQNARRLHRDAEVTEKAYLAGVDAMVTGTRQVILAAMDGDKLLSYQETFAVGDTAYLSQLRVSDEALSGHMGGLLLYEASQFWHRSGLVKQLCTGPTTPARPGISEFETRWAYLS